MLSRTESVQHTRAFDGRVPYTNVPIDTEEIATALLHSGQFLGFAGSSSSQSTSKSGSVVAVVLIEVAWRESGAPCMRDGIGVRAFSGLWSSSCIDAVSAAQLSDVDESSECPDCGGLLSWACMLDMMRKVESVVGAVCKTDPRISSTGPSCSATVPWSCNSDSHRFPHDSRVI